MSDQEANQAPSFPKGTKKPARPSGEPLAQHHHPEHHRDDYLRTLPHVTTMTELPSFNPFVGTPARRP